jgi:uncharacterized protein with FMN-binding domain
MKKKLVIVGTILIALIVVCVIGINIFSNSYDKKMRELTISNVDMSKIPDGTYKGNYKIFPIVVEVEIIIKDKKITKIDITKHQTGQGKPAEAIVNKVIEEQSLNVDTISGATGSSKVILKAIEIALTNAVK